MDLRPPVERLRATLPELSPLLAPLRAVTPTGRTVAVIGLLSWFGAVRLGWAELELIAGGCVVAFVIALLVTLGRSTLVTELYAEPPRVTVGGHAAAGVNVRNAGKRRTFGLRVEVPVGQGAARFDVPSLASDATWSDEFVIPTTRRCVLTVGPVRSVREDPLGLIRRGVAWSGTQDIFVHPRVVRLPALTAGWIRDLEGRPTTDLSPSDVAFHTLREYVPGDDRRHIHWKSSARHKKLLVRQFNDTRRSHLGLILSTGRADYASDDEFELAVSIVGSLGATALFDDQTVSFTTGARPLPVNHPTRLLDGLAGVDLSHRTGSIADLAQQSLPVVRGASVVAMVTGSNVDAAALRQASQTFHHDVRVLGINVRIGAEVSLLRTGMSTVFEVGQLEDLPRMLRATVAS